MNRLNLLQSIAWEQGYEALMEELRGIHSLEGLDRMIEFILKPEATQSTYSPVKGEVDG